MNSRTILPILGLGTLLLVSGACTDAKQVNAAFRQGEATWLVFDVNRADGLRQIPNLVASQKVEWKPRALAPAANSAYPIPGNRTGAVAVSNLGLLVLDDSSGQLEALRPQAIAPLSDYRSLKLFSWREKLFVSLTQDEGARAFPASLAWWVPGQDRVAFYPIPSQVRDPRRQAVEVLTPDGSDSLVRFRWKYPAGEGWSYDQTTIDLNTGIESTAAELMMPKKQELFPIHERLKGRLAERLGVEVEALAAVGDGAPLMYTTEGWVAVGALGGGKPKLYRLPDLGPAGRYTSALILAKGYVFAWETSFRGYTGAAGLVHLPFALLAP